MQQLENFISENLDFLFKNHGIKQVHSLGTGENGDALVELKNETLLVQIIQDRGLVSIYFANNQSPKDLFELSELIEILKGKSHIYRSTDPAAISLMKKDFNAIRDLLINDLADVIKKRDLLRKKTLRSLGYEDEGGK